MPSRSPMGVNASAGSNPQINYNQTQQSNLSVAQQHLANLVLNRNQNIAIFNQTYKKKLQESRKNSPQIRSQQQSLKPTVQTADLNPKQTPLELKIRNFSPMCAKQAGEPQRKQKRPSSRIAQGTFKNKAMSLQPQNSGTLGQNMDSTPGVLNFNQTNYIGEIYSTQKEGHFKMRRRTVTNTGPRPIQRIGFGLKNNSIGFTAEEVLVEVATKDDQDKFSTVCDEHINKLKTAKRKNFEQRQMIKNQTLLKPADSRNVGSSVHNTATKAKKNKSDIRNCLEIQRLQSANKEKGFNQQIKTNDNYQKIFTGGYSSFTSTSNREAYDNHMLAPKYEPSFFNFQDMRAVNAEKDYHFVGTAHQHLKEGYNFKKKPKEKQKSVAKKLLQAVEVIGRNSVTRERPKPRQRSGLGLHNSRSKQQIKHKCSSSELRLSNNSSRTSQLKSRKKHNKKVSSANCATPQGNVKVYVNEFDQPNSDNKLKKSAILVKDQKVDVFQQAIALDQQQQRHSRIFELDQSKESPSRNLKHSEYGKQAFSNFQATRKSDSKNSLSVSFQQLKQLSSSQSPKSNKVSDVVLTNQKNFQSQKSPYYFEQKKFRNLIEATNSTKQDTKNFKIGTTSAESFQNYSVEKKSSKRKDGNTKTSDLPECATQKSLQFDSQDRAEAIEIKKQKDKQELQQQLARYNQIAQNSQQMHKTINFSKKQSVPVPTTYYTGINPVRHARISSNTLNAPDVRRDNPQSYQALTKLFYDNIKLPTHKVVEQEQKYKTARFKSPLMHTNTLSPESNSGRSIITQPNAKHLKAYHWSNSVFDRHKVVNRRKQSSPDQISEQQQQFVAQKEALYSEATFGGFLAGTSCIQPSDKHPTASQAPTSGDQSVNSQEISIRGQNIHLKFERSPTEMMERVSRMIHYQKDNTQGGNSSPILNEAQDVNDDQTVVMVAVIKNQKKKGKTLSMRQGTPKKKSLPAADYEILPVEKQHPQEYVKLPSPSLNKVNKQNVLHDVEKEPVMDLKNHQINIVLRKANEFVQETFLKSNDTKIDIKKVQQLCQFFNIPLPSRFIQEPPKIKSREFQIAAKERILIAFYETINKEHGFLPPYYQSSVQPQSQLYVTPELSNSKFFGNPSDPLDINHQGNQQFQFPVNTYKQQERKFFVGRGNNYGVVRQVFKQRWWWQVTQVKKDECHGFDTSNFIWTQWRKDHLVNQLKTEEQIKDFYSKPEVKPCVQQLTPTISTKKIKRNKADTSRNLIQKDKLSVSKSPAPQKSPVNKKKKASASLHPIPQPTKAPRFQIYSKMECNYHLSNKKALFWNMCQYYRKIGKDPFEHLPLTYHIENGLGDPEFQTFKKYFLQLQNLINQRQNQLATAIRNSRQQENGTLAEYDSESTDEEAFAAKFGIQVPRNIWITKPGENSNQGNGITVCNTLQEITAEVDASARAGHTHIIQKYIDRPLLFNGRKFDMRVFGVLTSINSCIKGYFYEDGYIRTSTKQFSLDNLKSRYVHLTNDAIQQHSEGYGKFESGNKLSYSQLQKYLDHYYPERNVSIVNDILPQIKKLITESFIATFMKIDPHRRQHSFEIFGYDFMIDDQFKVYIIECNTNPSLDLCSPLSARIIPALLDNVFRVAVDPLFPPPDFNVAKKNITHEILPLNKLELVFDERIQGPALRELFKDQPELDLKIEDDEGADSDSSDDPVEEQESEAESLQ